MQLGLRGRVALVTGASSGIGQAIAAGLAREGVAVALVARSGDRLRAAAEEIAAAGGHAPCVVEADLRSSQAVAQAAHAAAAALGPVDILVNAAGESRPVAPDAADAEWDDAFDLNFHAARRMAAALLPAMRQRQWGRIVNISGSREPRALNAAIAAKGALLLWAKGLSCEVAPEGVTVNTIAPGRILSRQVLEKLHPTEAERELYARAHIPVGRFGQPEEVAGLAVFLASPLAGYVTGTVMPVDGGLQHFGA